MAITYKTETSVEITPEDIARIFWNLSDDEQCAFFEELARVIYADAGDGIKGKIAAESQWWHLGHAMKNRPIARAVLQSMSAGVWEHTLRYCNRQYANTDMPWKDEIA